MQIRINVKGASRKKAAIAQMTCEYPDREMTAGEFLAETVRQNVREYNARKDAVEILRLFAQDSEQGLDDYGVLADDRFLDLGHDVVYLFCTSSVVHN